DPENPGPQITNLRQTVLCPPAAEKGFLGDVLSVFRTADHEPERADQLVADFSKRAQKHVPGRRCSRGPGIRLSSDARARFFHTATLSDERYAVWIGGRLKYAFFNGNESGLIRSSANAFASRLRRAGLRSLK